MDIDAVYPDYLAALLDGDRQRCRGITGQLIEQGVETRRLYEDLFATSLYEIGELWEHGRISVATEHLATAITEGLFPLLYPKLFAVEHVNRSAVVSCSPNEYHQIGGKMVADILELHGWNGYFLGANTPVPDLLKAIDEKEPDLLALSFTVYFNLPQFREALDTITQTFPDLPVVVGGQALRWGGRHELEAQGTVQTMASLQALEDMIATWE